VLFVAFIQCFIYSQRYLTLSLFLKFFLRFYNFWFNWITILLDARLFVIFLSQEHNSPIQKLKFGLHECCELFGVFAGNDNFEEDVFLYFQNDAFLNLKAFSLWLPILGLHVEKIFIHFYQRWLRYLT